MKNDKKKVSIISIVAIVAVIAIIIVSVILGVNNNNKTNIYDEEYVDEATKNDERYKKYSDVKFGRKAVKVETVLPSDESKNGYVAIKIEEGKAIIELLDEKEKLINTFEKTYEGELAHKVVAVKDSIENFARVCILTDAGRVYIYSAKDEFKDNDEVIEKVNTEKIIDITYSAEDRSFGSILFLLTENGNLVTIDGLAYEKIVKDFIHSFGSYEVLKVNAKGEVYYTLTDKADFEYQRLLDNQGNEIVASKVYDFSYGAILSEDGRIYIVKYDNKYYAQPIYDSNITVDSTSLIEETAEGAQYKYCAKFELSDGNTHLIEANSGYDVKAKKIIEVEK